MDPQDPRVATFLERVVAEHGAELGQICQDLILRLPAPEAFQEGTILTQARHLFEGPFHDDLAAMNASPFDSGNE